MAAHQFKVSIRQPTRSRCVQFHGVAIREFRRQLGDNPSTEDGPPLGLDWDYTDVTRERSPDSTTDNDSGHTEGDTYPITVIPIDDYEQRCERKRRAKLMELCRLRQKSMIRILGVGGSSTKLSRRSSSKRTKHFGLDKSNINNDDPTLSDEQVRQLSAHWLKIQPLTRSERENIILSQTDSTKSDIENNETNLRKIRRQRQSTIASAETGIDDWQSMIEFFKRRYRRLKTGISKDKEQALLWEKSKDYWLKIGGSNCSNSTQSSSSVRSLRSSISSHSHYDRARVA